MPVCQFVKVSVGVCESLVSVCVCVHTQKHMSMCLRALGKQDPGFQLVIWAVFPEIASDS